MTRGAAITVQNNFTQGLITEFTAMNFPENAITEGDNCVFSELGSVTRRLGMDYEDSFVKNSVTVASTDTIAEFEWHSVGNLGTIQFLVQQIGGTLHFFAAGDSLSANKKSFTVNLQTYRTAGSTSNDVRQNACQFASGKGYLFVVHPNCDPIYVSYDADADTISAASIDIQIRDFEGIHETAEIDDRPSTLTNNHKYNLYNQGWYIDAITNGTASPRNVLEYWDAASSVFPSNADIWWLYKNSEEIMTSDLFNRFTLGNTPAPKGHYIYDAFNIDRTAKTGISGLTTQSAGPARPSAICWYAGRIFYAGVRADGFSDKLYFSQIIESDSQFGRCYQVNDPTSETIFDLLDTDGGTIILPLVEQVVSMRVLNDALIVIGTNGSFSIRGTDNGSFKATDYSVEYISSIGANADMSVVSVDDGLLWINYDAMYAMTKDNSGIFFQIQNISKQTIQSLIDSIPSANKAFIKGAYNKKDQKVQFLFSDDEDLTNYQYNRILEFNVVSKAFYTYTIDTAIGPKVAGISTLLGQKLVESQENVVDSLGANVTASGVQVTIGVNVFTPNSEVFKYTTIVSNQVTYSELWDVNLVDWRSQNTVGASYTSYGISGYRIRGDVLRPFTSTPIEFVVKYIDSGRCLVSAIWDYGFRQSSTQELYLTRPEVTYLLRRIKLRGKGRSCQIKFQNVGNNPFNLIGWSSYDTGGTVP